MGFYPFSGSPTCMGLVTDGAFTADARFVCLPDIDHELFLRLWEQKVFQLLVDEGKIEPKLATGAAPPGGAICRRRLFRAASARRRPRLPRAPALGAVGAGV